VQREQGECVWVGGQLATGDWRLATDDWVVGGGCGGGPVVDAHTGQDSPQASGISGSLRSAS
jgi:hypothetical protein